MKGIVFNIQKFCINDGPGIRTNVFLKGCPLRCVWCHNPESHKAAPQLSFDAKKCIGCRECLSTCGEEAHIFSENGHSIDRKKCIACGKCTENCFSDALELAGKEMTADQVLEEVLKDKVFYENSGGGLTLSGGEPLMQFDFSLEILKKAKEAWIHTCIETCGFAPKEKILKIAKLVDIFLFDYKLTDNELHKKYTGVSNEGIIENLKAIDKMGVKSILRCPIIPDVNDTDGHFRGIADTVNSLKNVLGIEIEPYHSLGNSKNERFGNTANIQIFNQPAPEKSEEWIAQIKKYTDISAKKA